MAELICRALRDGALEGELAPALTIKDSIASPFGFHVFSHVLAQLSGNILAGKSQSGGIILIAFSRSPSYYLDLLKSKGVDIASSNKWIRILDCYSDPLGWKDHLKEGGNSVNPSEEAPSIVSLCRNVRDLNRLSSLVIELGKGLVGQGKVRFGVAIDSVDELLRHSATTSVAGFLSNLRGHDQISSLFWLFHADLYEERVSAILEYMSSIVAGVEPLSGIGKRGNFENTVFEQNTRKGKFHVRFKRRNGRVRVMFEEYQVEQSGIKFTSIASEDAVVTQGFIPKVQFNLQLSEKERNDRANVVLPFEHQGNGKPIEIYDGRRSLGENLTDDINEESGKGEIIYFRDSDGEMPDSDEDPDDDLDI